MPNLRVPDPFRLLAELLATLNRMYERMDETALELPGPTQDVELEVPSEPRLIGAPPLEEQAQTLV